MSSRLRSLDSKISFFAFADIITAVSGVLIFVALLLATDLGRPTNSNSQAASRKNEQQLKEILSEQVEADEQNQRLQQLLASADTAPDTAKLQADIERLRRQLSEAQKKQAALAGQITDSQAAIAARDKVLGLTDLNNTVQRAGRAAASLARQEVEAHSEMDILEEQVTEKESQLLRLRQRDGELWLIPDQNTTTKEPILVTVAAAGITIERFDHPEQRRQADEAGADSILKSHLSKANPLNQYVVFLIRPSGIALFNDLVTMVRGMKFEVGYDALEENREIHFSPLPAVDETATPTNTAAVPDGQPAKENPANPATNAAAAMPAKQNQTSSATMPGIPPQKNKSWWQRLLEWLGLE